MLRETAQSGNSLSDEELKKITTRVWQRHDARIAAEGEKLSPAAWEMVPELDPELNPDISLWAEKGREYERERAEEKRENDRKKIPEYIKEACDDVLAAYRKNPELYDEGARYYQVFRRPLERAKGFYEKVATIDSNARTEHQHFWGDDGDNFGLMGENMGIIRADGVIRSDDGHTLDEYKKDIPGLGTRKFKGAYIRMARDMLQNEYGEYHLLTHNCQDYVDEVIALAGILAEKNNDTLEIKENTQMREVL